MKTKLITRGRRLGAAVRLAVERRINHEFERFATRIRSVTVRWTDENGPKGGVDAACVVTVDAPTLGPIVTRAIAVGNRDAASLALRRAGRAISKKLDRLKFGRRRGDGLSSAGA